MTTVPEMTPREEQAFEETRENKRDPYVETTAAGPEKPTMDVAELRRLRADGVGSIITTGMLARLGFGPQTAAYIPALIAAAPALLDAVETVARVQALADEGFHVDDAVREIDAIGPVVYAADLRAALANSD